ncbi:MAG: hemerythrin domain-containing protein [Polyangiaceae bacterium]
MIIGRGPKIFTDDVVDQLLACHGRIREFSSLASRIAREVEAPLADVSSAAARVDKYFSEALPLHKLDEELSLAPRLRGQTSIVDAALEQMCVEHHEHEALLASLVEHCRTLVLAPHELNKRAHDLARVGQAIQVAFDTHLAAEESKIFPQVRALPADVQRIIREEMRARRTGLFGVLQKETPQSFTALQVVRPSENP